MGGVIDMRITVGEGTNRIQLFFGSILWVLFQVDSSRKGQVSRPQTDILRSLTCHVASVKLRRR